MKKRKLREFMMEMRIEKSEAYAIHRSLPEEDEQKKYYDGKCDGITELIDRYEQCFRKYLK